MAYSVVRSRKSIRDLDAIFDHLVESYVNLGDAPVDAASRAASRIWAIRTSMNAIAAAPHQGTRVEKMAAGLRCVTKERAIFYFRVDDETKVVRILAIFFSGQDHQRHILKRLGRGL
jgi:plasmid stabilization system protein ParE